MRWVAEFGPKDRFSRVKQGACRRVAERDERRDWGRGIAVGVVREEGRERGGRAMTSRGRAEETNRARGGAVGAQLELG